MTTATIKAERINAGLALLRVVLGVVFAAHGAQKLFVYGLDGVTAGFAGMGIPMAGIAAPSVALIEFVGGLVLVAGLFTRWAGIGLAAVMLGALLIVHLPAGFFAPNGIEFVLTLMTGSLALSLTGPGAYSVDAVLARRRATA